MAEGSKTMKEISLSMDGEELDFITMSNISYDIAKKFNQDTSLLQWHDKKRNLCKSVSGCGKDLKGHVKVKINNGEYVFTYS